VIEARSVLIMTVAAALALVGLLFTVAHQYSVADYLPDRVCADDANPAAVVADCQERQ
jgi:hypothetical protein